MKKNKPESIASILKTLKAGTKLGEQLEQAVIWQNWGELAGKKISEHAIPTTIRDNVLVIEVDSNVWMHKFAYKKWAFIERVNKMARRELISDIYLILSEDIKGPDPQDNV